MKLLLKLALGLVAVAGLTTATLAEQAPPQWPAKPIRVVVPFPPGAATDMIARAFGSAVAQATGQPVVIDNKAGADGTIAGLEVMRAAPDGYTLLFATNSPMAAAPAMRKSPPYDPNSAFTPIADLGRYTFLIVVHPGVPARTLGELVQHAKANPGKLSYATGNTTGIFSTAQIMHLAGINMLHVPYKGEPAAMTDLIAGRVQFMVTAAGTAAPFVRDGRLRALAVLTPARSPVLPEVPTIAEAGMPRFSIQPWGAVYGPARMPREIVDRLNREFLAAGQRPEVQAALEKQGFMLTGSTPERLASFTKEQLDEYRSMMRAAGMVPE